MRQNQFIIAVRAGPVAVLLEYILFSYFIFLLLTIISISSTSTIITMANTPESIPIIYSVLYKLDPLPLEVLELTLGVIACDEANSLRLTTIDTMFIEFAH